MSGMLKPLGKSSKPNFFIKVGDFSPKSCIVHFRKKLQR